MNEYMLDIDLPEYFDSDFIALIPEQRAHINSLMKKGVIRSYSLAMDRTKLWVIMHVTSEQEVQEVFEEFPLYDYMDGDIRPLMFHQSVINSLPKLSPN